MPHITVKMVFGNSEEQKNQLAEAIVKDVKAALHQKDEAISVAVEEFDPKDWKEKVYEPEIQAKPGHLYKKPGYTM